MPAIPSIRRQRLHALGVTPYCLRDAAKAPDFADEPDRASAATVETGDTAIPCVILLPAECPQRTLDLIGRCMHVFGAGFARAPRLPVSAGAVASSPPVAQAYLAFGETQARALGHVLDTEVMRRAEIVLLDAPEALHDGAAKRRLWLALKSLRRRMQAH